MILGGNPALKRVQKMGAAAAENRATYGGIAAKSIYFVVLTFLSALMAFIGSVVLIEAGNIGLISALLTVSSLTTFIAGLIAILKPAATKIAGSIYAVGEGFMLGFIAMMFFSLGYSGEVFAALLSTVAVFGIMMTLYATGVIRVGSGFKKFMLSALIGILVVNLIMFIISLFSTELRNMFYGNGLLSIGISVVMVIVASLMILLDLNRMTEIVRGGLDKKYEWAASFGLLLTLVWLYMEFLRLFAKLASRKR